MRNEQIQALLELIETYEGKLQYMEARGKPNADEFNRVLAAKDRAENELVDLRNRIASRKNS
jgi:hypothetical protein